MRCCRCRLLFQTALVILTIYYFLFSGLLDWKQESMDVITTTTTDTPMEGTEEEWEEVVAKMGEQLVVKRSRNKNPRILEYPSL